MLQHYTTLHHFLVFIFILVFFFLIWKFEKYLEMSEKVDAVNRKMAQTIISLSALRCFKVLVLDLGHLGTVVLPGKIAQGPGFGRTVPLATELILIFLIELFLLVT